MLSSRSLQSFAVQSTIDTFTNLGLEQIAARIYSVLLPQTAFFYEDFMHSLGIFMFRAVSFLDLMTPAIDTSWYTTTTTITGFISILAAR